MFWRTSVKLHVRLALERLDLTPKRLIQACDRVRLRVLTDGDLSTLLEQILTPGWKSNDLRTTGPGQKWAGRPVLGDTWNYRQLEAYQSAISPTDAVNC